MDMDVLKHQSLNPILSLNVHAVHVNWNWNWYMYILYVEYLKTCFLCMVVFDTTCLYNSIVLVLGEGGDGDKDQ